MSFWMKTDLWKHEVEDVLQAYPDAKWRESIHEGKPARTWRLKMTPIPSQDELGYVLADLEVGRTVAIHQCGRISHSLKCEVPIDTHPMLLPKLKVPQQTYLVDFVYRSQLKNATGPTQPKAFIINPEISVRTYPYHPHMYNNYYGSWACPLSPQDKSWSWGEGASVKYLDQVAIWLLKTSVWSKTGAGIAGLGRWVGNDTSHDPAFLFSSIQATDPCWCGRGVCYGNCHMQKDGIQAITRRVMSFSKYAVDGKDR